MRLFVAVKLNNEARRYIADVQREFRRQNVRGNYIPPENLHITLAFIGEYPDPDRVAELLETVPFGPFAVVMEKTGCFGELRWAGFRDSRELDALAGRVRRALADGDVPYDKKRFRPHVTFLRNAVCPEGAIPRINAGSVTVPVEGFSLMRSDRGKRGMIYTELNSFGFPD